MVADPVREPFNPPADTPRLTRIGDLLGALRADAEAAHAARVAGLARGPVTRLDKLDRILGGALAVGAHVVHAGPGVGKTAFALQLASTCGCPSLYVTAEMAPLELLRRLTARVTGQYLDRLRSGEYTPDRVVELAEQAVATAPLLAIADATQAYASPGWLRDAATAIRGEHPHLLLVLDSLHSWVDAVPEEIDEYVRVSMGMGAARTLAGQLRAAVLVVVERNRPAMRTGGISAGAGSRKIEYGAETVLGLDRVDESAAAGPVEIQLTVEKNRSGSPGAKLRLHFHGALQKFEMA